MNTKTLVSPSAPEQRGRVARLLDQLQAQGQFVVAVEELARASGLTYLAVRRQIDRLSRRVARLPGRPSAYVLVPPEHQIRGAPPVEAWLDAYFRLRDQPYYLGLLSAAAMHGSSQQAVQVTQVLTTRPMRPLAIGRVHVTFYVKSSLRQTPLSLLAGMPAPLAVSSPEATAIDLVAFSDRIGGIAQATRVIEGLKPAMTLSGMKRALAAEPQAAVKQRLGYVLSVLGWNRMADEVRKSLPHRLAPAVLQTRTQPGAPRGTLRQPWMVLDNIDLQAEWR